MRRIVDLGNGREIILLDSVSEIEPGDAGRVVVTGSHGGSSAAEIAGPASPRLVIFNDAGIGKDEAGVHGLLMLERYGVAAATVSHLSARIGEARDTLDAGVLSRVNESAARLGLKRSLKLSDAIGAL